MSCFKQILEDFSKYCLLLILIYVHCCALNTTRFHQSLFYIKNRKTFIRKTLIDTYIFLESLHQGERAKKIEIT